MNYWDRNKKSMVICKLKHNKKVKKYISREEPENANTVNDSEKSF